ncbi:hypothetical protein [Halobaculum roseum]|uniref:Uncharacterized protein n=1 Tax=Halobaculum roseum TaxID=2175149 RepID=A0ABD5MLK7_9EURY|nr:hypothetical protein [Halobaculum roseum]
MSLSHPRTRADINASVRAAASTYAQRNELAFRFLQILEHVRD